MTPSQFKASDRGESSIPDVMPAGCRPVWRAGPPWPHPTAQQRRSESSARHRRTPPASSTPSSSACGGRGSEVLRLSRRPSAELGPPRAGRCTTCRCRRPATNAPTATRWSPGWPTRAPHSVVDDAQWLDAGRCVVVGVAERPPTEADASWPTAPSPVTPAGRARRGAGPRPAAGRPRSARRGRGGRVGGHRARLRGRRPPGRRRARPDRRACPDLIELVLAAWSADGIETGGRLTRRPRPRPGAGRRLRAEVDELAPAPARCWPPSAPAPTSTTSCSAPPPTSPRPAGRGHRRPRGAGPGHLAGEVVPVVAAAVTEMDARGRPAPLPRRLAAALAERGPRPPAPASTWPPPAPRAPTPPPTWRRRRHAGRGSGVGRRLVRAGARRRHAGHRHRRRRAEAAALGGDPVAALRLADAVMATWLPRTGAGLGGRAVRRRAAASGAGRPPGSASWRRPPPATATTPPWPLLATLGTVATGGPLDGAAAGPTADGRRRRGRGRPGGRSAAADESGPSCLRHGMPGGCPWCRSSRRRAARVAHTSLVLPTSPHAIGATVALALCELSTAEHLLARARDHDVGGATLRHPPPPRPRLGGGPQRPLVRGPVGPRRRRRRGPGAPRGPGGGGHRGGAGRRSGDLARLGDAWTRAEGVLLRHPADLFSSRSWASWPSAPPGSACGTGWRPKARELGDVVRSLGEPPAVAAAAALDRPPGGAGHR